MSNWLIRKSLITWNISSAVYHSLVYNDTYLLGYVKTCSLYFLKNFKMVIFFCEKNAFTSDIKQKIAHWSDEFSTDGLGEMLFIICKCLLLKAFVSKFMIWKRKISFSQLIYFKSKFWNLQVIHCFMNLSFSRKVGFSIKWRVLFISLRWNKFPEDRH